ncbi:Zn-ribbon domain-containing OB-fold protein [Pseudomonas fluorescens]|jgi:uncharacterized OB-fold protein|uniref:Zn-ribbon domain-containing OB-fold protein n=1 Tax=Pseudomonas fluorescens TaxID=294 RepID=UPI0020C38295|nr:zinc ribbon domain-containing protein [Pseudomonas fluorescens]UTL88917.1 zinc ribbon domain-containing protein [Pseudomonas fluorescens]
MAFMIQQCVGCGQASFPPRYSCPRCGEAQWQEVSAQVGRVAQATVVRARVSMAGAEQLHLASVELLEGPVVIAQTAGPLPPGTLVDVAIDEHRRIIAQPACRDV